MCLALLSLSCSVSKAQESTTTYQIGDDGYVNVKLPFNFTLYDTTFNNSWMYDNGVISFLDPSAPGALSPWQWNSTSLSQAPGKYFIAALWADIAPVTSTTYSTSTDGTFLKYSWNNISEYYSGGTRLNSFNTTIKPDGSIATTYTNINLQTSNVSIGTVGDPAKGQVNQVYWADYGATVTTLPDWTQQGTGAIDPCLENVTSSPTCPGYAEAMLKLIPTPTSVTETVGPTTATSTPVQLAAPTTTAPTNPTTAVETTITTATSVAAVTSAAPTALNPQPKIGEVSVAGSTKPTTSASLISSILNAEQSRVQQAEKMVAEQVKDITAQVTASAEATAAGSAAMSIEAAAASALKTISQTAAVANSVIGVPGAAVNTGVAVNPMQAFDVPDHQQVSGIAMQTAAYQPPTQQAAVDTSLERTLTDDIATRDVLTAPPAAEQQDQKPTPAVNNKTADNDAAGSVTIASIAVVPLGFEAYSVAMRDMAFYSPSQVYKNQKTVDNIRVLRMMNAKSDQLHQQMVDQQYNKGN